MNVSSTSLVGAAFPPPGGDPSAMQNMKGLIEAIKSGDVESAKTAYEAVSADKKAGAGGPLDDFLSQLGTDLKNGDIGGAQSHLKSFDDNMRSARSGHQGEPPRPKMDMDLVKLFQAVQTGDTATAQSQLQTVTEKFGADASGTSPLSTLLGAIGNALQSGDVGSAQKALAGFGQHFPKGSAVGLSA